MKRCIVCGNVGDDDSVVCNVCGNPFIDMESDADDGEASLEPDERIEEQLKEVLTKVQEDESAAQPDSAPQPEQAVTEEMLRVDEPGVTVLPEEDFAASVPQSGEAVEPSAQIRPESEAEDAYETFAKQAETHAKQAEVFAKQAETYAEQAEASAKQAETIVERAAEEPVQSAAEAFAKRMAEVPQKKDTVTPAESAAAALARREMEAPEEVPTEEPAAAAAEALARREMDISAEAEETEPATPASEPLARQEMETPVQDESDILTKNEANAQRQGRPRRTKSGPQIYGQDSMAEFEGAQGVIRRDVHGGHAGENVVYGSAVQSDPLQPRRRPETAQRQNTAASADMRSSQRPAEGRAAAGTGMTGNASGAVGQQQKPSVQPYAQTPQENRGVSQQAHHHSGKSSSLARRVTEASKDALTSPLLLVVALFQTVFLAGSVAAIFMRELSYGQIAKLLNLLDLPSQLRGYVSMFQAAMAQLDQGALAINLVIRVPDLLLCLGLWLIFILAHGSKEKMSGIGFMLLQIVTIIEMIAACVVLLVVLILSVTLVIAAWSGGTQSLLIIAVVTLICAIVVTMAIVMYFFCYLSTIRIISTNARKGECCGKVSSYVAVVHMILALTGIINVLSGIVNLEITGIAAGVGQIGWMLLFGVWILKYRSTLSEYNE
ncbi:MAG: hypothetical protein LUD12_04470 [Lachnospiraceae bacterium]|nr:hypothetical protein [Lachnospiraceae bacterium]